MQGDEGDGVRGEQRVAGLLLVGAGGLFLVVVTYLFAVLLPLGLTFDMLDEPAALLAWLGRHSGAYTTLYLLYLGQQLVLLAAVVAARRAWCRGGFGSDLARDVSAAAGLVSVTLALASIAILIMTTHAGTEAWRVATGDGQRATVVATYETAADLGKGARLASELPFGWWLGWLGLTAWRSARSRLWLVLVALGAWTAAVGLWKLLDPFMPFEDWLAFLIAAGLLGAGLGVLREASLSPIRRPARSGTSSRL